MWPKSGRSFYNINSFRIDPLFNEYNPPPPTHLKEQEIQIKKEKGLFFLINVFFSLKIDSTPCEKKWEIKKESLIYLERKFFGNQKSLKSF